MIGPEGGFDARESAAAKAQGFQAMRLGRACCAPTRRPRRRIAVVQSHGEIGDDTARHRR
jgi:hypothetical protein